MRGTTHLVPQPDGYICASMRRLRARQPLNSTGSTSSTTLRNYEVIAQIIDKSSERSQGDRPDQYV